VNRVIEKVPAGPERDAPASSKSLASVARRQFIGCNVRRTAMKEIEKRNEGKMRELTDAELKQVLGGKIEPVTRNPQGHETQGTPGKAQTTQNENPVGHAPPGQNP
jgi:hypothetical protein